jgi:hypothetical protein
MRTKHDLKHARTTELGEANRIDSTSGHFPPKAPVLDRTVWTNKSAVRPTWLRSSLS